MSEVKDDDITMIDYYVDLGDSDVLRIAAVMAALDHDEDQLILEKKKAVSEWDSKIQAIKTDKKRIASSIRTRKEKMTAACISRPNYDAGTMEYVSVDEGNIGEVVKTRQLTVEERQLNLFQ